MRSGTSIRGFVRLSVTRAEFLGNGLNLNNTRDKYTGRSSVSNVWTLPKFDLTKSCMSFFAGFSNPNRERFVERGIGRTSFCQEEWVDDHRLRRGQKVSSRKWLLHRRRSHRLPLPPSQTGVEEEGKGWIHSGLRWFVGFRLFLAVLALYFCW